VTSVRFDAAQDKGPNQFFQTQPGLAIVEPLDRRGETLVELLVGAEQSGIDELEQVP
jgi:hypothetical protein